MRRDVTRTLIGGMALLILAACGEDGPQGAPDAAGDEVAGEDANGAKDVTADEATPEDVAPELPPEDVVPDEATPEDVVPDEATPEDVTPDVGPEDVLPDEATPGDVLPDEATPGDVVADDGTPEDVTPDPGPEDVVTDEGTPEDVVPDGGTPDVAADAGDEDVGGDAGPTGEAACNDGLDDDGDGGIDCADLDCAGVPLCQAPSPCCEAAAGAGCAAEPAVAACVCADDPFCCEGLWDLACAAKATLCGGRCATGCWADCPPAVEDCAVAGDEDGDGLADCADPDCADLEACGGPLDCCTPKPQAGCGADPAVEACVCAIDATCCTDDWDLSCAHKAKLSCLAACELPPEKCTGGVDEDGDLSVDCLDPDCIGVWPCAVAAPACCTWSGPGCAEDPEIEACVCAADPSCCAEDWDDVCVFLAEGCGAQCPPQVPPGTCCDASATPGCPDSPDLQACVCGFDPTCCSGTWDDACVFMATYKCGLVCAAP